MIVKNYSDVEAEDVEGVKGVKIRWLITKKRDCAPNFAMRMFEIEPNAATPYHRHEWEHEVFILDGECEVVGEDGSVRCRAGDVIFVPGNEPHQFKNVGDTVLKFLCLIPEK